VYQLTANQIALKELASKVVQDEIRPGADEREEKGIFPWEPFMALRKKGILSLPFPKEYGGGSAGLLDACLVLEEVSKACNSTGSLLVLHWMAPTLLGKGGSEAQKSKYLPPLASGDIIWAFAVTDATGGSDAGHMGTSGVLEGDDYVINGEKRFISCAHEASFMVLFFRSEQVKGRKGISAIIIDMKPKNKLPGLTLKREKLISTESHGAFQLIFQNFRVPTKNLVGNPGDGFRILIETVNYSRPMVAARGLGTAQGALDYALDFVKERKAFGQTIASLQAIQFMLADMATEIEAARQLVYMAASYNEHGGPNPALYSSMAKLFATDVAMKVTIQSVQLLGGDGCTLCHPVQRLMKDAKILQVVEGTNQIQRATISHQLIGKSKR
jgi:alkylation response protein AidB-like acyl-CoA dehydrogenase